jgi:hypothetical protein
MSAFCPPTGWTLWVTTLVMAGGAAFLYYEGRGLTGEDRTHTVVSVFIPT